MKLETLKKSHKKQIIIGAICLILVVAAIAFTTTRAKYKTTQSINIASGTVNYSVPDLRVVAVYLEGDNGYSISNDVPTSGYTLNTEKSVCKVATSTSGIENAPVDDTITIEYKNGAVDFYGITKNNTRCYLYFDKYIPPITKDDIIASRIETERGEITGPLTEDTTGKIYSDTDDDGKSYYFAGAVTDNWVQFGGFYWRIIRINGDGSIRMIYSGVANGNVSEANKTGTTTQISNDGGTTTVYAFNMSYADNAYVGYMYGTPGSSTYAATHANTNSSTIKRVLDTWYAANLNKTGIKEYIDTNAGFCGDRQVDKSALTSYQGDGYGTQTTGYAPWARLYSNGWKSTPNPTLKCSQNNDLYTVSGATKGNKALKYPIGLITSDEVVYAGGMGGQSNSSYYLYTGQYYWTMSPCNMGANGYASVFLVNSSGILNGDLGSHWAEGTLGVRPVINLKADTKFVAGGNGTSSNPYVLQ